MPRPAFTISLDRMAVGLSGLCVLHCVASVVLVSTLSIGAAFLSDASIHEFGLGLAVAIAAVALGLGYARHRAVLPTVIGSGGLALMAAALAVPHGLAEVLMTILGVSVLAVAHVLNGRASA